MACYILIVYFFYFQCLFVIFLCLWQMKAYFQTYQLFFKENLPQLFAHFSALQITPDIYIIDWSELCFLA